MAKARRTTPGLDPEISAIRRITAILSDLSMTQRVRVWQFVGSRLSDGSMPSITPTPASRDTDSDGLPSGDLFPVDGDETDLVPEAGS